MSESRLTESEYRFAQLVWQHEPVGSGELVTLCRAELGWKKSTTYTVLKNVCDKGVLVNQNAVVRSRLPMEQVQRSHSEQFLNQTFGGSLPRFVASFIDGRKPDSKELEELRTLLDSYTEKEV